MRPLLGSPMRRVSRGTGFGSFLTARRQGGGRGGGGTRESEGRLRWSRGPLHRVRLPDCSDWGPMGPCDARGERRRSGNWAARRPSDAARIPDRRASSPPAARTCLHVLSPPSQAAYNHRPGPTRIAAAAGGAAADHSASADRAGSSERAGRHGSLLLGTATRGRRHLTLKHGWLGSLFALALPRHCRSKRALEAADNENVN
jgi:hypothetical protein